MPPRRGADGETGGLLASRTAGVTTGAPPLRRDERDADHTEARARVTDRTRARLARHGRFLDPAACDLHRDIRLGILTTFAPLQQMSLARTRSGRPPRCDRPERRRRASLASLAASTAQALARSAHALVIAHEDQHLARLGALGGVHLHDLADRPQSLRQFCRAARHCPRLLRARLLHPDHLAFEFDYYSSVGSLPKRRRESRLVSDDHHRG